MISITTAQYVLPNSQLPFVRSLIRQCSGHTHLARMLAHAVYLDQRYICPICAQLIKLESCLAIDGMVWPSTHLD